MADDELHMQDVSEEEVNAMEATTNAVKQQRKQHTSLQKRTPVKLEHRHRAQSIIQSKALDELETEVFETGLYENSDLSTGSSYGVMGAEILYSYVWWSIFHALPAMVWFFPLCEMEISGYEAAAFVWFSPIFTLIGPIRRAISTPFGLMVLRLLSIVGVASFQAPTNKSRLLILAAGNLFVMLGWVANWWNMSKLDRHRRIYLHLLGYLFFLAVRVWGSTFNYIYMSYQLNNVVSVLCVPLAIYLYIRDQRTPVISHELSEPPRANTRYPGLLATGVGFGALLFLTGLLFGEVSVIVRYSVVPIGEQGPQPWPWGLATLCALTVGLLGSGHCRDLLSSHPWTMVGLFFSMVFYFMESYTAFFGGLILAVYTMSLLPHISKRLVNFPSGKVFPIAMLSYFFLLLLSVWVVAYKFVPGGVITRERSDAMHVLLILLIGMASRKFGSEHESSKMHSQKAANKKSTLFGRFFRRLSTITEEDSEEWQETTRGSTTHQVRARELIVAEEKEGRRFHSKAIKVGVAIILLALLGFASRYRPYPPMPVEEHPNIVSGGIWAFHFGYDNKAFPSMERAAQLILNSEVDVIGLLETDAARHFIGSRDIATWLEERLNVYVDYGPGPKAHTFGCLLVSRYPIVKSTHHLLPSPEGEIAPAIVATVNVSGSLVDFLVVHFGNEEDNLDRKLQAHAVAELLANATNPIVMLSYVTDRHGSRDYKTIVEKGNVNDIDTTDRKRFCEYIFYRGLIRLGYARISHGGLSDTEVQIGKFRIPSSPAEPDHSTVTQNPEDVPAWTHFPDMFGKLFQGHYYDESRHHFHMNTPKYFKV
ncbi:PGAP2-interacting protein-like isoform X2 [Halichondria panicea]|uniref:PGAP2-interacting protein-like isoform X2 n=1 Tax=Halichondria panicea TaxID=6063 RepID=UPI00312BB405